jgi:hypothetical protein
VPGRRRPGGHALTGIQHAALHLHYAFADAGFERRIGVHDSVLDVGLFDTEDATRLYRRLGGDERDLHDLALDDWHDHERFADQLQTTALAATGRALLVESEPTCGHCRDQHGGHRIRLDYLDTEDALALSTALRRPTAPVDPHLSRHSSTAVRAGSLTPSTAEGAS